MRVVVGRGNVELNLILNHGERKAGSGIICFPEVLSAVEVKHSVYAQKNKNLVLYMVQTQSLMNESPLPYMETTSFGTHKSCDIFSCF